ncbi:SusC/RagA family TonB-linked outer membrane protein [Bacteroides thetaiotaomicron]|uniref:SusC/RagA family TonB-linked outer membrane protein n=1 Tax=Bacteroides thetaiotaomicron TaxID=818 RepID=UPI00374E0E6C|nr:TonB-dependent receptor [Bacteroides thetaiotaomicron]
MEHYPIIKKQFRFCWKEWYTIYLFFLFLFGLPFTLNAETDENMYILQNEAKIKLKGVILSADNEPVVGANVRIEGTNIGVVADIDGEFSLSVPSEGCKITISFIGFKSQTLTFNGKNQNTFRSITLFEDENLLDEVAVVAFGKQKKESVIASISTIKPAELKVPSSNLTTALAGRMAGIIAYQRSGEPGQDNADFFVRGVTTFGTGKKDPLILIDGIELTASDLGRLNTDDIETFSIMKDANATALYGARGANGVILVTTKEGKEGAAKFSVRFENSFSAATRNVELADPVTYMKLYNEAVKTRNPLGVDFYSEDKINNTGKPGANPYVYPATDWQKELLKDFTSNQRLNVNLSGGGKVARYYIAAQYNQDNGLLKVAKENNFNSNINLKKFSLRTNVNMNITPSTEVIFRMHGTFDSYKGPMQGGTEVYRSIMRTNPVLFPAVYPKDEANKHTRHLLFGNYDGANYVNPYADLVKGYKDYSESLALAQVELKQNFDFLLKGLSARVMFNTTRYSYFDVTRSYQPYYYRIGSYDKKSDVYQLLALNNEDGTEYLSYNEGEKRVTSTTYLEAAVQYNQTFAQKHSVSGLLVYTLREELNGNAGSLLLSLPKRNIGLAGRFTYAYDSRYFVEANFGYNGSERFAAKERFGFFPSAGIGYIISNEAFWGIDKNIVSKLKLKATYGLVGNDQIGSPNDRFFYLSNVNLDDSGRSYYWGTNFDYYVAGVSTSRYADPYITWETSYKQNYGFELGLFNKIELQGDFFIERRKKILQNRASIPTTMGLQSSPQANIGETKGSGFELSLDYDEVISKDLWITARGNFTYAKAKYVVFEEPSYFDSPWRRETGAQLGQGRGLIAERLFVDDEDVRNSPRQDFGAYSAGDIKYKDINNDGIINAKDIVPIGYPTSPEIIYGAGFSIGYKNFDFSSFFQGSARSSFWIETTGADHVSPFGGDRALLKVIADDHWSETDRNIHAFWPRLSVGGMSNNNERSTWFMRDGSFVRWKSAELGYTLPKDISRKARVEVARLYLSATNLMSFSKFKLWDPEMAGNGLGYPLQRVINIGINLTF